MPAIQIISDREEIVVGDTAFSGGAATGGGLSLEGRVVRPLTLAERDALVVLATTTTGHSPAPKPPSQLARLVARAAAPGFTPDASESMRAAIEAVALHLAGASMSGALTRTSLVVRRCVGAAADDMPALEADLLADALAPGLTDAGSAAQANRGDTGWTTITYAMPETDASQQTDESVFATRDRLAAALVRRGLEPLDKALIAGLLREDSIRLDAPRGDADARAETAVSTRDTTWELAEATTSEAANTWSVEHPDGLGDGRWEPRPHKAADTRSERNRPTPDRWVAQATRPVRPHSPVAPFAPIRPGSAATQAESDPSVAPPGQIWPGARPNDPQPAGHIDPMPPTTGLPSPAGFAHGTSSWEWSAATVLSWPQHPRFGQRTGPRAARSEGEPESPPTSDWQDRAAREALDLTAAASALDRAADLRGLPR
ncbi:hypothetical protein FHX52_0792 [Humibacillus xanthopallidus]|uniref:Uncharacterized protein n=1 Tax=Humibacillus xanthopallidus TaxID=412689 RepID=A0A543PUD8_9MICO|nr:hypothetical protein [Humibacillus xanthopallidus]TQN47683.1 hypothetical protein FHX52_0792 [Humibacillus xanthopallidus]